MIVVLGRPRAAASPRTRESDGVRPAGLAAGIACAAAAAGGSVELVGSIGDDPAGDAVVVALGRAGVGHAALLRDPGGSSVDDARMPRLDRADVELGLRYLSHCGVLVLAEALPGDAEDAALDAAAFHRAQVIAVVPPGAAVSTRLAGAGTVLGRPADEASEAFVRTVARYAVELDSGAEPAAAFSTAVQAAGWAPSA